MMLRKMNHRGSFAKKLFHRKAERGMSRTLAVALAALGVIGLMIFVRELPSLRRYIRIERM